MIAHFSRLQKLDHAQRVFDIWDFRFQIGFSLGRVGLHEFVFALKNRKLEPNRVSPQRQRTEERRCRDSRHGFLKFAKGRLDLLVWST